VLLVVAVFFGEVVTVWSSSIKLVVADING